MGRLLAKKLVIAYHADVRALEGPWYGRQRVPVGRAWERLAAAARGEEVKLRENDGVCVTQVIYMYHQARWVPPKVQRKTAPRKG
jgi:hypothetical protein